MHEQDFDIDPPSDDLQAAEYVLGVLDAEGRRTSEARIAADPAFAALVDLWEQRFAALFAEIAPVDVPAHVWLQLRTRLGWSPVEGARPPLLQRVSFWRGATAAALATAAVLAVVAVMGPSTLPVPPSAPVPAPIVTAPAMPEPASEQPKPVVVLARDDGQTGWLAAVDAVSGAVTMVPVPTTPGGQGQAGELWLIPEGGAPLSLGFVSHERAHTIDVPDPLRAQLIAGAVLAITLEPEAGIPHAAPTGPVVAQGSILTL